MRTALLIVALLLTLQGCASYRAGPPAPLAQSVSIAPVRNESFAPEVSAIVTEHLRDAFLRGNSVRLTSTSDARTRLEVTLKDFSREGRAYGLAVPGPDGGIERDRGMARAFDLSLIAHVRLIDAETGALILERDVVAESQSVPSPYLEASPDDERLLMPVLARELARQIYDLVASGWSS